MRFVAVLVSVFLLMGVSAADSIVIDGTRYDNVRVTESSRMYYVQIPDEGRTITALKSEVDEVQITGDASEREALHRKWEKESGTRPAAASETAESSSLRARQEGSRIPVIESRNPRSVLPPRVMNYAVRNQGHGRDGMVRNVNLQDVPAGQALEAILRSHGLNYQVRDNVVYISTPRQLDDATRRNLQLRIQNLRANGQTLPKIVVNNPGGSGGTFAFGGGFGGTGGGGGLQGGGIGGGQGIGGPGAGGVGGAAGVGGAGGAAGIGGGVGGAGGGQAFGGQFLNISQLFTTIDDRLVGEPPAVIGLGGMTARGGR